MGRNTITINLDADDVARARFTVSPAHEIVRIVRVLVAPTRFPAHRALMRDVRRAVPRDAYETLAQVVTARGYVPDFLTPLTEEPGEIASMIAQARPTQVSRELSELLDDGRCDPVAMRRLAADPEAAARTLAAAVEEFWRATVAPLWPAMRQVLVADIRARTSTLATSGFGAMITSLHPTLTWTGSAVVRASSIYGDHSGPGRGLILVPSIFGWPNVQTSTDPGRPPTVLYPARNATSEWARPPDASIGRLLGQTRARVLAHLDFPATTSDVASALGLAVSTAHHHLDVLCAAGLVDRHREGNAVWHLRTRLGDELRRR